MKVPLVLVTISTCVGVGLTGRAFPVQSEYDTAEMFRKINGRIRWDSTNFLVDLSGPYAVCAVFSQRRRGQVTVNRRTPEGVGITGLVDYIRGGATDAKAQEVYIKKALFSWIHQRPFLDIISRAQTFGCSVQPGCSRHAVIACLFDTKFADRPKTPSNLKSKAKAFTPEQYVLAESITHHSWDRSHFLENLSGRETSCDMVNAANWDFRHAREEAAHHKLRVEGVFGIARNKGDTQDAMIQLLLQWDLYYQKLAIKKVGCSLISDCIVGTDMYVVQSCLFSIK